MTDKEFIKQHINFSALKKAGMFKGIERSEHTKIVERFLRFFGQTKEQYILSLPTFDLQLSPDQINGHMAHYVDKDGKLHTDTGFHLSIAE